MYKNSEMKNDKLMLAVNVHEEKVWSFLLCKNTDQYEIWNKRQNYDRVFKRSTTEWRLFKNGANHL